MPKISSNKSFREALASLSAQQQRLVGACLIKNVLDLTKNKQIIQAQSVSASSDATADDIKQAYQAAHNSYIDTHPHSEMDALDWATQAEYFIAKACMTCLDPACEKSLKHHLAQRVSMYCMMARACANIDHDGNYPTFHTTEEVTKKEVDDQYRIVNEFIEKE
ncbi:MAG: hypothetical protein QNL05_15095 [Gammaproteobacteria bacterium]|nr:hypothetical protein [Gammaproteobacteria bacterium]